MKNEIKLAIAVIVPLLGWIGVFLDPFTTLIVVLGIVGTIFLSCLIYMLLDIFLK